MDLVTSMWQQTLTSLGNAYGAVVMPRKSDRVERAASSESKLEVRGCYIGSRTLLVADRPDILHLSMVAEEEIEKNVIYGRDGRWHRACKDACLLDRVRPRNQTFHAGLDQSRTTKARLLVRFSKVHTF